MMVKAAYTMISPVLSKQTREKVEFLGSDWKEVLVREVSQFLILGRSRSPIFPLLPVVSQKP